MSGTSRTSTLLFLAATFLHSVPAVHSLTNYANDFINPNYVLSKNFTDTTLPARDTILQWANDSISGGPWSVTTKPYLAPSGDKHDYMSWAPYWWPDCSKVGNTTELTPQQIWTTCPYVSKDGQFNPDARLVNNVGDFDSLANAVLYNSLAWALDGNGLYSTRVATFINAWFLDPDTYMNPNLNYAQMNRGPTGQNGTHTGILDLKCMAKIASGILVLRQGKAAEWTSDIDTQFNAWLTDYVSWLTSAQIALQEKAATNNHGSFYFNQLAAIQLLMNDTAGTQTTVEEYFNGIYMGQISGNGDQPLESARTRPYHYRSYNLAAMITNARIGEYVGVIAWNKTTKDNGTIQAACNYAMTIPAGQEDPTELYPDIAAVASQYGDSNNTYSNFLANAEGSAYVSDASFFWNQPFSDHGFAATLNQNNTSSSGGNSSSQTSGGKPAHNAGTRVGETWSAYRYLYGACSLVMAVSFLDFL